MDHDTLTTDALRHLNALHTQCMALLAETMDAAEDGVSPLEGIRLGAHYVQASMAILSALKQMPVAVRGRIREIVPQTHFVYEGKDV